MKVVKQPLFCPACAAPEVWTDEDDPGDYYAGTEFYCLTCHACLPDLSGVAAGNAVKGSPAHGLDAFSLGEYIAIREAAGAEPAITAQLREVHAKARAAQEARQAEQDARMREARASIVRRESPSGGVCWVDTRKP